MLTNVACIFRNFPFFFFQEFVMTLPPFPSTNIAHGALLSPCHHPSCPPPYLALPLTHLPQFTPFSRYLASDCPADPGKYAPPFLSLLFCLLCCGQTVFVFALQEHKYTPFPQQKQIQSSTNPKVPTNPKLQSSTNSKVPTNPKIETWEICTCHHRENCKSNFQSLCFWECGTLI